MTDSELTMKKAAEKLGVPISDVPNVVRNLLKELAETEAKITQLK